MLGREKENEKSPTPWAPARSFYKRSVTHEARLLTEFGATHLL